jgi:hypothetical protein
MSKSKKYWHELSDLQSGKYFLKNFRWLKDYGGYYWEAEFYSKKSRKRIGITGTYYNMTENKRPSKKS